MPEVEIELRAQVERARNMGINLTHLDAHMGTAVSTPDLFQVYLKMGEAFNLPELLVRPSEGQIPHGVVPPAEKVLVDQVLEMNPGVDAAHWLEWYEKALTPLKPGVYQLIVHLAYDDDEMRGATWDHPDWGAAWRQQDFNLVKSPEFQKF